MATKHNKENILPNYNIIAFNLLIITGSALLAPIIAHFTKRYRVPGLVIEIILGVLIGPQVFNLVQLDLQITTIAHVGLTFLLFLAGYEIEIKRIWGEPLKLAGISWIMSLLLGFGLALLLVETGHAIHTILLGLSLTTMSLGVVFPLLTDAKMSTSEFSKYVFSVGTLGEFGPILVMTLLLTNSSPGITLLFLVFFVGVTVIAAFLAKGTHQPALLKFVRRHLGANSQITVRISMFLLFFLVYLTLNLGLNVLMGAFAAGIVVRLFTVENDVKIVASKLKAIGFGFLIPIFFIVSGVAFDLDALFSVDALIRVPVLVGLLLIVRGLPIAIFYRRVLGKYERRALVFFSGIGLPLIVVIAHIGVHSGKMIPANAAYLVAAGLLSILIFPSLGLKQLKKAQYELDFKD